ncbi:43b33eb8-37ef-49f4-b47b-6ffffae2564d-CDS [Sclerotinia trifoliorum]|uniref:43b33eb8-37ef-49f4-b47b-6ffffae2564d-CDS n=1 Tax=Sclerotinia trifoliorum TaxID=28548 RepID=A0A8H2VXR3_9HELO|nr:43b33eb8-37ef-49f4-b47b-6ffffae2564d-CDS [Sclerotinia trifoliorum]
MPFNQLQRRDSWPPTIIHLGESNLDLESIDENPFSYFLTSPDEITDDDIDDFSAGIESDDEEKSEVRQISPSALQRAPLDDDDDEEDVLFGFAIPLSLKDFTKFYGSGRESRAAHRKDKNLKGLGISIPDFTASRGRAKVRLTPPRSPIRGQTRSLPLRRPHSWREPSPDLGSIKEERESEDVEEAKGIASAPATSVVSSKAVASPKPKKKVHWAL